MSVYGGVRREMNLISYKWERHINDDSDVLYPGWDLKITLGPIDIDVYRVSRRYFRTYRWGFCAFGYDVSFSRNWESPKKFVFGDASERLLK
jgi:hypothetical protein